MNNIIRSAALNFCATPSVTSPPQQSNNGLAGDPEAMRRRLSFSKRGPFAAAFLLLIVPFLCGQTVPTKTVQRAPALRNVAASSSKKAPANNKTVTANNKSIAANKAAAANNKAAVTRTLSWSGRLAPLPTNEKAVATHAPYDAGDCSLCHKIGDVQNPGPVNLKGSELCLSCHEDYQGVLARKYGHIPAKESCTNCHNPHNSMHPKLLVEEAGTLCLTCHKGMKDQLGQMPVKHDALTQGAQCANCHNPHGANIEHLLIQLPMQLCLQCHGKDDVVDHDGKKLANMKKLLDENPKHHGPVAAEDCSACHEVHACVQDHNIRDGVPYGPKGWTLKLNYAKTPTGGSCEKTCHQTKTYDNKTNTVVSAQQ